jgi:diguanylate cyclase (GGDEF)-like protein
MKFNGLKLSPFQVQPWHQILLGSITATGMAVAINLTGIFQLVEWAIFDQFVRSRPKEVPDSHVVVVTFDEADLDAVGDWPIPDDVLALILKRIIAEQPRVIGLDIYRNLRVGEGYEELAEVFKTTPNLYGVSVQVGDKEIGASPVLSELGRVTLADLTLDIDSKVRRGLLSTIQNDRLKLSISAQVALDYLALEGIEPIPLEDKDNRIRLGQIIVAPLRGNEGGYIRTDSGGFQILINYRGTTQDFNTMSVNDILANRIPQGLMTDRVVLIGSTAASLNDVFQTSFNGGLSPRPADPVPGVIIHANVASQLINGALGERAMFMMVADPWEWLWAWAWSALGGGIIWSFLHRSGVLGQASGLSVLLIVAGLEATLLVCAYGIFLVNWWLPIVPASVGLGFAALFSVFWVNRKLHGLAMLDSLTMVANRRLFDRFLHHAFLDPKGEVALVLCDIDFFKQYNDTYGHPQGDICLQQVAEALQRSVRSRDLVARYGGEEFAVVLRGANPDRAKQVAERIRKHIESLAIPHGASPNQACITISCGVSSRVFNQPMQPEDLILLADQALYCSKEQGRNCVTMAV